MQTPYHLLKNVATHYPATHGEDKQHIPTSAYSAAAATIPCRLQPINTEQAMQYDAETASTTFNCWLAPVNSAGTAVAIVTADRVSVDGVMYTVQGDMTNPAGDGALFKVILRKESRVP